MNAFNKEKYLKLQSEKILERISQFDNKLYLEFGGKIFDDYHASRVLPGFEADSKINMLKKIKDKVEVIIAISSLDIESNKVRGDLDTTYENEVLRLINAFKEIGFELSNVVITKYNHEKSVDVFKQKLENMGIKVYLHYPIEGYPYNVSKIISDEGYGKNEYVETTKPLVVVTAPGPGSGKMAVCLSQLYHDSIRGIMSGYAKFETFPVWNLTLKHPLNLAYEAATTDLNDFNEVDPFHLEAYNQITTNYNRDVEAFPVLKEMFVRMYGKSPYNSPTDMGVNMIGFCIEDEEAVKEACRREVCRRYLDSLCNQKNGKVDQSVVDKNFSIMKQLDTNVEDRRCVVAARNKSETNNGIPAVAIELNDGTIITGKQSQALSATGAAIINALKHYAGISDRLKMISPKVINPMKSLKTEYLGRHVGRLNASEVLLALSISQATNSFVEEALPYLKELSNTEAHSTHFLSYDDEKTLKRLNIHITKDPVYL